ncbi:MAG TPA: lysylphosphatidylglycerol synthase domain-containing protein [Gemmatimonadales bacterium]|nr:lysylphosphatidylglycerol synthase domain-containing protein [Gemmatimonadales bacterium]
MSLKLRLVLFLVGLALAALVIHQVGLRTLAQHLATAGWLLFPIVLVWGVVYLFNALGWRTLLSIEPSRPGVARTWFISVTSFALNYVTPAAGLGGEAFRVAAIASWLGTQRAVGSVVQYRLLFALAHMLFVLVALVPALWLLPGTPVAYAMMGLSLVMGGVVAWFLIRRHQEGILEAGLDLLLALPLIRRLAAGLEGRRPRLRELDRQITTIYHEHPAAFRRALLIEFLARFVAAFEMCVILWGLGLGWRFGTAVVLSALSTTFANLFFFLPFELGAREGGLFLVFKLLGLAPEHGVFTAIVTRLRELTWILLGLAFLWVSGGKVEARPGPAPGAEPGA